MSIGKIASFIVFFRVSVVKVKAREERKEIAFTLTKEGVAFSLNNVGR